MVKKPKQFTREQLCAEVRKGKARIVVDHINHEEYLHKNGYRYSCGWESPQARLARKGGWRTYKTSPEGGF